MDWKKLTLDNIRRLVATIKRASPNPDVVQAVIDQTPTEPIKHGRVTLETVINLLEQLGGTTVIPEEVLALLRQPEPPLVEPLTGPVIDCDAPASDIANARVLHHHLRGQIVWDLRQVKLYVPINEHIQICDSELIEGQPTMNMCAMEYLRNHQQLIPSDWQRLKLFFPGTTYSCTGTVYVPFLYNEKHPDGAGQWKRSFTPITHQFGENDVIVLYQPAEPAAITPLAPPKLTFEELIAACRFDEVDDIINKNNFPLVDNEPARPIEEIALFINTSGEKAVEYLQHHKLRPVGMRRALEYIAIHRSEIVNQNKKIAIVGAVNNNKSPVVLTGVQFNLVVLNFSAIYPSTFCFLATRE